MSGASAAHRAVEVMATEVADAVRNIFQLFGFGSEGSEKKVEVNFESVIKLAVSKKYEYVPVPVAEWPRWPSTDPKWWRHLAESRECCPGESTLGR